MYLRRQKQKGVFPCGGGGRVKMATQAILLLTQEADSPPKQVDFPLKRVDSVKVAISHVTQQVT